MSFLKIKKNIIIIISLISAILFSTFAVLIVNLVVMKYSEKVVAEVSATLSGSGTANSPYLIKSQDDLVEFSTNQSMYNTSYVKLNTDVDFENMVFDFDSFSGVFNGNGKTISNIKVKGNYLDEQNTGKQNIDLYFYGYGFFGELIDAYVYDLKLVNVRCDFSTGGAFSAIAVGGVAGYADESSLIEGCSVERLIANSTSNTSYYAYASGIMGSGNGCVANCYAKDVQSEGSYLNDSCVIAGIGPAMQEVNILNRKGLVSSDAVVETCVAINNGYSYGISAVSSITDSYSEPNKTDGLDCSSVGGTSGTVWYQYESYNGGGYPYLRKFMTWQKLLVKPANTSNCSVSASSVYIPTGVEIPYSKINGTISTSETLDIYGHSVVAKPKTNYKMLHWIYSSSVKTYYAYVERITFKISFINCSNTKTTLTDMQFGTQYNINSGSEITIEYVSYKEDCYSSIKFTFYDPDIDGDRSVQYEAINGYYLVAPSLKNQTDYVDHGERGYYKVTANVLNITPSTELKTYNPEFS